jgi:hypothetical protein
MINVEKVLLCEDLPVMGAGFFLFYGSGYAPPATNVSILHDVPHAASRVARVKR